MTPPDIYNPNEDTIGADSYIEHVADAASFEAFQRKAPTDDLLLSAEALPENSSLIDFKAFAQEYPEKLKPLLAKLRPEFLEYFVEYYLLEKTQAFIGQTHGCIQTRVWQNLRIIEQFLGAMILLGTDPTAETLRPILTQEKLEQTPYGSLTGMILAYAASHSYKAAAEQFRAPVPMIRKIFRPAIQQLLASKNVRSVAVGAYLRCLTHQASLTGVGIGKKALARIKRVKVRKFHAPPSNQSPILSFGYRPEKLQEEPWCMLEISSNHRMSQIYPALALQCQRIFRKQPIQIFAPVDENGDLRFGYIFARSAKQRTLRALLRVRGIAEISAQYDDEGAAIRAITIPHEDVRTMMASCPVPEPVQIRQGDFVEVLTGPAANYSGTVVEAGLKDNEELVVKVSFPTGKTFLITADTSCVKLLPNRPEHLRRFWGLRL